MGTILVGVDGSPASLDALRWAGELGVLRGDSVVVAHVLEHELDDVPRDAIAEALAVEQERVEGWAGEGGLRVPWAVAVLHGRPGAALAQAAVDHGADLVVSGTEGTEGRFGPRLGSVANHLAHRLAAPFVAVPVGCTWRGLRTIVVGLDGSAPSDAAARFAAHLSAETGAKVEARYACTAPVEWVLRIDPRSWYQSAVQDLQHWSRPFERDEVAYEAVVVDSAHPALALLDAAAGADADLLVVGSRPLGRHVDARIGGTALQVLHRARVPTALVTS
jgi:nucleotide-binding universal stress UspA family protein